MCCATKFGVFGLLLSLMFGRGGCCPADVPVQVTLDVAPTSIVAPGGNAVLTAHLAAAFTEDLTLHLDAQQTPAGSPGYQLSAADVIIPAGQTEGTVTVTSLSLSVPQVTVVFRVSQVSTATCSWDVDIAAGTLTIDSPGSLQVTLTPAEAVSAGAQWNVDGGDWQDSGAIVTGLSASAHTVNYKSIQGWTAPASEDVTITDGQTTSITRVYTPLPGALQVFLLPEGIGSELGAQWSVDGGDLQDSGATVSNLSPGTHSVAYTTVQGWIAPPTEDVTITSDETLQITRTYTQDPPK